MKWGKNCLKQIIYLTNLAQSLTHTKQSLSCSLFTLTNKQLLTQNSHTCALGHDAFKWCSQTSASSRVWFLHLLPALSLADTCPPCDGCHTHHCQGFGHLAEIVLGRKGSCRPKDKWLSGCEPGKQCLLLWMATDIPDNPSSDTGLRHKQAHGDIQCFSYPHFLGVTCCFWL